MIQAAHHVDDGKERAPWRHANPEEQTSSSGRGSPAGETLASGLRGRGPERRVGRGARLRPDDAGADAPAAAAAEAKPAEEAKGPNTGRVSISAGVDWTTAYFFRGIKQETEDLILQPYGEVSFKLVENAGALTSLSLTPGIWNSIHTGPTSESPIASDPKAWYELDGYVRLSAVLWEDLTTYALYTAYTSPSGAFGTVQEIAFGVGYNDAKLLGPFALNPSFLVAFELDGQADAGARRASTPRSASRRATHSSPTLRTRWPSPFPWRSA